MFFETCTQKMEVNVLFSGLQAEIRQALEHACDRVKKYKQKCVAYVDKHSEELIKMFLSHMSPKDICRKLQFCVTVNYDDCKLNLMMVYYTNRQWQSWVLSTF